MSSVVVAISGPFGTFETQSLLWRLLYWAGVIGVSIPIGILSRTFWSQIIAPYPDWVEDVAAVGTMALVFGPLIVGFNISLIENTVYKAIGWPTVSLLTFIIGMGLVTMRRWAQAELQPIDVTRPRDRLLDRIDAPVGVRLARVTSDNHHIRILTDDGAEYRILMRLRDAVAEIDVEAGLCIHRSHWVATNRVQGVTDTDGKEAVRLICGTTIPIGPKFRPELVSAGVLPA